MGIVAEVTQVAFHASSNSSKVVRGCLECGRPAYVSVTVALGAVERADNTTFWCRRCFSTDRLRRVERFLRFSHLSPFIVLRSAL